jgi:hypothetical protein
MQAAGLVLGLISGYLILRLKKRPWPYSWPFSRNSRAIILDNESIAPVARTQVLPPRRNGETSPDVVAEFVSKRQSVSVAREPLKPEKSEILSEVEANLAIATSPWMGKLTPFQIKVMGNNRSRFDALQPDLREDLTEAYTDMHLANTLAWLSMDVGRKSKDMDESYLKLCNKIAARLERVIPPLMRSGL